ncbi:MAG: hypothetical protein DCF17_16420 [Shackletoniella antarctica]|uniref:Uncharacterized protein n=1 Tax=Shackletoniella antarctica TaxID=268115 RepID=A0A2W4W0M1_9CYAN|nr:MAG: hypothetical protein DCF17_16420 [Shackletoniella antarctica]
MFDGREQMGIRVLDIDLQKLTDTRVAGDTSDFWISDVACDPEIRDCDVFTEGIIYAFREDAVREDEIVRPKTSAASSDCLTVKTVTSDACRMDLSIAAPKDPPLTAAGISLKPVDFYADPDRRPSGFRLRNGVDMSRSKARKVGMTFVTDNSVYVLGNFNLHSTEGTVASIIEEFKPKIGGIDWTFNNFYRDRVADPANANGIDIRFSQQDDDTWRPVEILADSFNILSAGFLDGAVEDTFTRARPIVTAGIPITSVSTSTSYMNQSRPNDAQTTIVRENGANTPVWINRNGTAFVGTAPIYTAVAPDDWTGLRDTNDERLFNVRLIEDPTVAYVNAVVIAGIVPNRPQQSYGGLHNFPRLNEMWSSGSDTNQNLQIAGAFFQLNFSTAATGPFEQDAWEPSQSPGSKENIGYYRAPNRRWGYDPGLLYYPPAAAARRFVSVGTPRSEYFRELPSDDPYITNLRCAVVVDGGDPVYDDSIRGTCPPPA